MRGLKAALLKMLGLSLNETRVADQASQPDQASDQAVCANFEPCEVQGKDTRHMYRVGSNCTDVGNEVMLICHRDQVLLL